MKPQHARAESIRSGIWEAGLLLVLPLIFQPGFPEPFTTPKLFLAQCLVVCGLAIAGLGWIWRAPRRKLRPRLQLPFFAFCLAAFASCLLSPVPRFSLTEVEFTLCGPVWVLLLVSWNDSGPGVRKVYFWISLAGSLVAGIVVLQRFGFDPVLLRGYQVDWGSMVARMRLYSTFGNPNFVGGYLIGAIFPALAWVAASNSPWVRALGATAALVMLAATILTGSRGAWLGLAVGTGVAAILLLPRRSASAGSQPARAAFPGAKGDSKGLFSISPWGTWGVAMLTISLAERVAVQLRGRIYLWRFSWPAFRQHPLLGSGWGVYQLMYLELQGKFLATHPQYTHFWTNNRLLHNDPLQLLLETGLVGFAAFAWVLMSYAKGAWSLRTRGAVSWTRYANAASAAGACAILADSIFNYQFAVPPTYILLFTLLAVPDLLQVDEGAARDKAPAQQRRGRPILKLAASLAILGIAGALVWQQWRILRSEYFYQTAMDLEERDNLDRAEGAFRQSAALNNFNGRAHFGLSRVLYTRGNSAEALREITQAEQTYADSHEEVLRGRILEMMGRNDEAVDAYRHALWLDPTLTSPQQDIERLRHER